MIQILLLALMIVLLPFPADAAYNIYLRNGSVMSGVSSYEKQNGDVIIYFGGGSLGVKANDILRIEETGAPEQDFRRPDLPGEREVAPPVAPGDQQSAQKSARRDQLNAELETVNADIKAVENEEARLVKTINDRKGARLTYNALQLRQLESDLAPVQQELSETQVKKGALYQKRTTIENELQNLQ